MNPTRLPEMPRRTFMAMIAGGLLAAPLAAGGQQAGKVYRVGYLGNIPPITPEMKQHAAAWFQALREHGFVEGQNLVIERRYAEGRAERFAEFAAELVRNRVDVISVIGPQAALAAARATKTIPIVFWGVGWPVEQGLVQSLAWPGGNVTGATWSTGPEVVGKQLQLLKEIAPKTARLGWLDSILASEDVAGKQLRLTAHAIEPMARTLGMELHRFPVQQPEDFDAAFARILESRSDAMGLLGDVLTYAARKRIAEFANRNALPSTYGMKDFVVSGGLLSYGADPVDMSRKVGTYVGRILRGSKPRDLPVEQPTKFELVINLKTAKALGLTIPQSLLQRADDVVQ